MLLTQILTRVTILQNLATRIVLISNSFAMLRIFLPFLQGFSCVYDVSAPIFKQFCSIFTIISYYFSVYIRFSTVSAPIFNIFAVREVFRSSIVMKIYNVVCIIYKKSMCKNDLLQYSLLVFIEFSITINIVSSFCIIDTCCIFMPCYCIFFQHLCSVLPILQYVAPIRTHFTWFCSVFLIFAKVLQCFCMV